LSVAFLRDSTRKIYSPMIARDQTQANHKTSIRQTGAIRFRNFNSGQTELVATEQQMVSFCLPHRQLWLSSEQLFQGSYALAWGIFEPATFPLLGTEHTATPPRLWYDCRNS